MRENRFIGNMKIRRGMESDAVALRELLGSLEDEGEVWSKMFGAIEGKEEDWIRSKMKDDRVHNTRIPGSGYSLLLVVKS